LPGDPDGRSRRKAPFADRTLGRLNWDGRALAVEPHATGGRLKLSRSALEGRTNYRGVMANHPVRQVTGFRAFDKDAYRREDELF
jgi:hypothetical protein